MFNKLLIANRGEIALRIIKTAKRLGISTVAVYSTADKKSEHVNQADEAYWIGESPAQQSYLNIDAIIHAAQNSGAKAIHPGYGFLSENPKFAEACNTAGLIFVGPSASAMNAMASKQLAKQLLEKTTVPLTPGYHGENQSSDTLLEKAKIIGFPVLLKAAAGGGGKGMRIVSCEKDFLAALESAKREAASSFADSTMLIEKLITNARHVEIQIMADNHGNVVHLFDRDCSIQRRHQKVIEEAPAPNLSDETRQKMAQAAIAVAKKIDYSGAGTVEFLVSQDETFYFMEMNTRLQVEHPVTEAITGLDIVELQLLIAANHPLPIKQSDIRHRGHAIESRLYAEDPENNFMPSTGILSFLKLPKLPKVRIDTGVFTGSPISVYYDPMIAKLITHGSNRNEAIRLMEQALKDFHVGGIKSNRTFLQAIVSHPSFIQEKINTDFLKNETLQYPELKPQFAATLAACADYVEAYPVDEDLLGQDAFGWQMHLQGHWQAEYQTKNEKIKVLIRPIIANQLSIEINGASKTYSISTKRKKMILESELKKHTVFCQPIPSGWEFYTDNGDISVTRAKHEQESQGSEGFAELKSPMPATVVSVLKHKGDNIKAGEPLMILEAMKMEHTIVAPKDGQIDDVYFSMGEQVQEGVELMAITGND